MTAADIRYIIDEWRECDDSDFYIKCHEHRLHLSKKILGGEEIPMHIKLAAKQRSRLLI
ncbi:MAG: hypothetical protein KAS78_02060 [Candidatus Pacebacteria bacterium]|nr:hypothetical protein [Candidatus Paceibacterota bacterium]